MKEQVKEESKYEKAIAQSKSGDKLNLSLVKISNKKREGQSKINGNFIFTIN